MEPYRIKHKDTGLYYKPGDSNLSRTGKIYVTGSNILNYLKHLDYLYIGSDNRSLIKQLEDLGYENMQFGGPSKPCFKIPKSEFEVEYITIKPNSAIWS